MRALVTGHLGFLGNHFAAELRDRGYDVRGLDLRFDTDAHSEFSLIPSLATTYDLVVHAAARSPHRVAIDSNPASSIYNQHLDAAMFDWAVRTGQRRVLYLSSCAVLDGPDDYGWTKLTGERMAAQARRDGVPVTVVRPYSGYGTLQSEDFPFGAFLARAKARRDPFTIWGDGRQVRDWVHVDDVVSGALALVESGIEEPVSICTGVGTSMIDVARMICAQVGYEPEFLLDPEGPAGVGRRVGDPSMLRRWYEPKVDLAEGVRRAVRGIFR